MRQKTTQKLKWLNLIMMWRNICYWTSKILIFRVPCEVSNPKLSLINPMFNIFIQNWLNQNNRENFHCAVVALTCFITCVNDYNPISTFPPTPFSSLILVTRTKVKVLWMKYWMHNIHANTNIHVDQHITMQFKLLKRWNINRCYDKFEKKLTHCIHIGIFTSNTWDVEVLILGTLNCKCGLLF